MMSIVDVAAFWSNDEEVCTVCKHFLMEHETEYSVPKCRVLEEDLADNECPCLGYSQLKAAYMINN